MDEIKVGSKVIVKVGRNEIQAVVLKAWAGHWYVKSEATGRAFFTHRLVCVAEDSARASVNPNVQLVGACEIDHVFNDVIREQERNQATTQENTMPENEIEQNVNEIEVAEPESTLPGAAWPGCERWRSGDETKMPLPVASRTVSNKHTATFFQNNTLSSLLFRWREGIVTMKPNLTYAARSR